MALTPGSERTETWLHPPVQPHLTAYAFHITNPNAVLAGKKPILEEKGPFVYKVTLLNLISLWCKKSLNATIRKVLRTWKVFSPLKLFNFKFNTD
jgi:hypothetical protein